MNKSVQVVCTNDICLETDVLKLTNQNKFTKVLHWLLYSQSNKFSKHLVLFIAVIESTAIVALFFWREHNDSTGASCVT
jgi:hypothetical protein